MLFNLRLNNLSMVIVRLQVGMIQNVFSDSSRFDMEYTLRFLGQIAVVGSNLKVLKIYESSHLRLNQRK